MTGTAIAQRALAGHFERFFGKSKVSGSVSYEMGEKTAGFFVRATSTI
jgi:hypothetical protein